MQPKINKLNFETTLIWKDFSLNLFIFGCIGSSLLSNGLRRAGATLRCGAQASHCGGFSCCRARALGARASVVVECGLSCSAACGIFPDQGLNLCPLHWQADSQGKSSKSYLLFRDIFVQLPTWMGWQRKDNQYLSLQTVLKFLFL